MFQVPIAAITLVYADRQWWKARVGLDTAETARQISTCGHAILSNDICVIEDTKADERFSDDPLAENQPVIRFCAGYPLGTKGGARIGTLCVIDHQPRSFGEAERSLLRDLGQMLEAELVVMQLATHDTLTELANRRGFERVIQKILAVCDRNGTAVSLLYFDLDGFKLINDIHGHKEGDRALVDFAGLLTRVFRSSDVVARLGGDEFIVVLTGTGAKDLQTAVELFAQAIAEHNAKPGRRYSLAYSAGVFTRDAARHRSLPELLEEADRLMYEQKRRRKRQAGYSSE
jgi:diguanylate cyclase (GGDEF)-like protein